MDLSRARATSGLPTPPRTGLLLAAVAGVLAVIVLLAVGFGEDTLEPPPPLTAEDVERYLEVAPAIRADRAAARRAGEPAASWHLRPAFRGALESVDWELTDYLRVEGQVSAARLRLERPDVFAAEFQEADAPPAALELVEPRLEEIRRVQARTPARLGDG